MSKRGLIPAPSKIGCRKRIPLLAKHRGDGTDQSPQVGLHRAAAVTYLSSLMPLHRTRAIGMDGR